MEFKKDCATYKIKNLAGNDRSYVHYGVLNKWLYVANSNFIKITVIEGEVENGAEIEIERAQNQIRTHEIKEPCKIHGFIENKHSKAGNYLVTLVETEDN